MASWKKILTALPAMTDLGTGTPGSLFLKGDGTWATPSTGLNNYLDGVTVSGTTVTYSLNGGTDVTSGSIFGSNAFNSTAFTTNAGTVTSATAGTGMTQTGTSTINPTLNVIGGTGITANANDIALTNTAVTAGSYTFSAITVDAQGRITAASSGTDTSGDDNEFSFKTIAVDGESNVVADTTTDTLTFDTAGGMSITTSGDTITFSSSDNDTTNTEAVQDIVGAMFTGNTETRGSLAYDDADGTIDLVVDNMNQVVAYTSAITLAQAQAAIGYGNQKLVPAAAATTKFLRGDGSFEAPNYIANTDVNVSVANLKTALAGGFAGNAVTIGDSDDVVTIGNDLTVTGDLLVSGDTVTVNTSTLSVEDINIELANGSSSAAASSGAGLTVRTGGVASAQLLWKNGGQFGEWILQRNGDATSLPIQVCQLEVTSGTPTGLDNINGTMAYNSADNEMWLYI